VQIRKITEPPPVPQPQKTPSPPPPAPSPQPAKASTVAPQPTVRKDDRQAGTALAISAGYRQHLGWPGYLREMTRLGGMFYLFDPFYEKIKAQIEFHPVQFKDVDVATLKRMSPRIREISGEIAISDVLSHARLKFGPGRYAVILLLPHDVDDRVQADAIAGLSASELKPTEIVRLNGEYQSGGGSLELRVYEAVRNDGVILPVNFTVRM
jgi:hypothetical protein